MQVHVPLASYTVAAFNALPEFGVAKASYPDKRRVLDRFADIIREHCAEQYLGAALIHKHYPLHEEELMVEEIKRDGSLLAPRRGVRASDIVPYLWHLTVLGGSMYWTPVEFVIAETIPSDVRAFSESLPTRATLLSDLAVTLASNDAQNTFGLALLHRQAIDFDRAEQILLESPGPTDRSLVVKPVDPDVKESGDWTQTYWHFDLNAKRQIASCNDHGCAGYCSKHG